MNIVLSNLILVMMLGTTFIFSNVSAASPSSQNRAATETHDQKENLLDRQKPIILVVGASGSIGQPVVEQAYRKGYETRALVRDPKQARLFPEGVEVVVGDLTRPETLHEAVIGVTGIIFTHGISGNDPKGAEQVNYGAVRNILSVLKAPARIALMTTVGVTKPTVGHDWKRRGERLVRASGLPYTIVRPGWFDYNDSDQHQLVLRQGDTHWTGSPSDGVVSRSQIAQVLVESLTSSSANHKTFELVAEKGPAQTNLDPLFAALPADPAEQIDAINDRDNLPLKEEPKNVLRDIDLVREQFKK
ncbi:SDR family oxidoreductase [Pantoea sp. GM01]|uniref:SDR family oxidoreductase n=1 Tax=Pantoea sp. GM01 TaxID=1144320 RepID=UPI000270F0A1|nr:SDR family oxidoreductase [Pantoea sp. GM01]EJL93178.1 putative nucleoside-diphosphate sugar epimerase [Pantoea sp. GM01]